MYDKKQQELLNEACVHIKNLLEEFGETAEEQYKVLDYKRAQVLSDRVNSAADFISSIGLGSEVFSPKLKRDTTPQEGIEKAMKLFGA